MTLTAVAPPGATGAIELSRVVDDTAASPPT